MRLSNRKKVSLYNFIHTVLWMIMSAGAAIFFFEKYTLNILGNEKILFLIVPILLLVFFYSLGRQIFEYDSDGEAVHFRNKSLLPIIRSKSDEFPKYKIISFQMHRFFLYKRLYVKISSKTSKIIILRYQISYLQKRDIADLKRSLQKIVHANQQKMSEK